MWWLAGLWVQPASTNPSKGSRAVITSYLNRRPARAFGSRAPPGSYEESRRPKRCRDGVRTSPRALFAAEKTLRVCNPNPLWPPGISAPGVGQHSPLEDTEGALMGLKAWSCPGNNQIMGQGSQGMGHALSRAVLPLGSPDRGESFSFPTSTGGESPQNHRGLLCSATSGRWLYSISNFLPFSTTEKGDFSATKSRDFCGNKDSDFSGTKGTDFRGQKRPAMFFTLKFKFCPRLSPLCWPSSCSCCPLAPRPGQAAQAWNSPSCPQVSEKTFFHLCGY